ncbi:MAG: nuclear transport factor 2 family protein [Deltaproteobacteria bacterium]|nr:nuclear transport factor 2 family protein [Deltaproteobacteria bacterium]
MSSPGAPHAAPDEDSLLRANERFYRTFERLDPVAMAALWEHSDRVCCVHPGWPPLWGTLPVQDSWRRIIANTGEIRFSLKGTRAHLRSGVGIVTLFEHIWNRSGDERQNSATFATNLFAWDDASRQWLLFHHQASYTPVMPEEPEPLLV